MAKLTKIYTRTGDDGSTALGSGRRVRKTDSRIEACGCVDELNAQLGVVLCSPASADSLGPLRRIQNELFHLGADLCIPQADKPAAPGPRIEPRHVRGLEELIDTLNAELPPLENFVLPGGAPAAAQLHVARTICRRCERVCLRLREAEAIGEQVIAYLNRLSDALFVLARIENQRAGVDEPTWDSRA